MGSGGDKHRTACKGLMWVEGHRIERDSGGGGGAKAEAKVSRTVR
jgi:hypothetical protein